MGKMQVESSATAFQVSYSASQSNEVRERFEIRPGRAAPASNASAPSQEDSTSLTDAKSLITAWVYEYFTGHRADLRRFASAPKAVSNGRGQPSWGVSYSRQEIHQEKESSTFAAQGTVKLTSGKEISFSLKLSLNRESTTVNGVTFQAGQSADPIAVNFDGSRCTVIRERQKFDLNGDGKDELIATLASGSAWLAQDKNGDGVVNNGKELFGPSSGSGFGELAALDSDHNGWVDSGDSAYNSLGVFQDGKFTSLTEAGIGALAVASAATPFSLKQGSQLLGTVQRSGVYLTEDGSGSATARRSHYLAAKLRFWRVPGSLQYCPL